MPKLPKNAKNGQIVSKKVEVKGKERKLKWQYHSKPFGKNKNLHWKLKSNKPA